jgi:hypothetical protein
MRSIFILVLLFPFNLFGQNQWELFDAYFADTQWIDTLEFTYEDVFRVKDKFYKDSTLRIDRELRNALLPDSLKRQSIPMFKWQNGDTTYYYTVENISIWNWGYLYVKVKCQDSFLSIIQVLRSEPGDGGQLLDYGKVFKTKGELRLKKSFDFSSSYYSIKDRHAGFYIKKTKLYWFNPKLNSFEVLRSKYSKNIYYHKPW